MNTKGGLIDLGKRAECSDRAGSPGEDQERHHETRRISTPLQVHKDETWVFGSEAGNTTAFPTPAASWLCTRLGSAGAQKQLSPWKFSKGEAPRRSPKFSTPPEWLGLHISQSHSKLLAVMSLQISIYDFTVPRTKLNSASCMTGHRAVAIPALEIPQKPSPLSTDVITQYFLGAAVA